MFGRFFEGIETPKHFGGIPKFSNVTGKAPEEPEFNNNGIPKFSNVPTEDEPWDDIPEIPDFSKEK